MTMLSWSWINRIGAGLTALGYALFTLLPNSHGRMAAWPFVLFWQLTLGAGFLWSLSQLYRRRRWEGFGKPWDYLTLTGLILVLLSAVGSQFHPQAVIQSWAVVALVAILYGLRGWLNPPDPDPLLTPHRRRWLLRFQGALNLGFICLGLALWIGRVYLPEQALLAKFQAVGVEQSFDFNAIQLRNPYPLGHANYVAGYLLLALPILLILFLQEKGWTRWLWLWGIGAGLADLFLTSSRGGFFALGVLLLFALVGAARWGSLSRRRLWGLTVGAGALGAVLLLSNNRLRGSLVSLLQGQGFSELSFRSITNAVGWAMGSAHWLTGAGLGNVPLLYQKYRPYWAGQEAEWLYEVLSTPMQIFAELGAGGLIGLLIMVLSAVSVLWRWEKKSQFREEERRTVWALASGLGAYGIMALTDFQLDNLAIGGSLLIYAALLASFEPAPAAVQTYVWARPAALAGLALFLGFSLWQAPMLGAWRLSARGFAALAQENFPAFEDSLTQAQELAPWEPYYPEMLGSMLGEAALKSPDPQEKEERLNQAIAAFERAVALSPYREFSHNNLGVLQLVNNQPGAAAQSFRRALDLLPAKPGLFYQLGLSLQAQQQTRLAVMAFSLECLRHPLFITSPLWRRPLLAPLYPTVQRQILTDIQGLLQDSDLKPEVKTQLRQIQGGLYWWQGNWPQAKPVLSEHGSPVAQALLTLALQPNTPAQTFTQIPLPARQVIEAFQTPARRLPLLQQAWVAQGQALLGEKPKRELLTSMAQAKTFSQWLRESAPTASYRRYRLGHNINSRHLDGPNPSDFFVTADNIPMSLWFADLFPDRKLDPALDSALQPWRRELLAEVAALGG